MLTRRTFFRRTIGAVILTAATFYGWPDTPVDLQSEACETGGLLVPEEYMAEIASAYLKGKPGAAVSADWRGVRTRWVRLSAESADESEALRRCWQSRFGDEPMPDPNECDPTVHRLFEALRRRTT